MTFKSILRGLVYGFRKDERGSIAVEAVVILPMVFWTYLAMYGTFHSYRTYAVNQKAAYTIGDMISRETNPLDEEYMQGAKELMMYLTNGSFDDVAVRVTSVKYDAASGDYEREWSQSEGNVSAASNAMVAEWSIDLPILPDNEYIVVVETFLQYDPPFNTGLQHREVRNFVFTKPRYAPRVLWLNAG